MTNGLIVWQRTTRCQYLNFNFHFILPRIVPLTLHPKTQDQVHRLPIRLPLRLHLTPRAAPPAPAPAHHPPYGPYFRRNVGPIARRAISGHIPSPYGITCGAFTPLRPHTCAAMSSHGPPPPLAARRGGPRVRPPRTDRSPSSRAKPGL